MISQTKSSAQIRLKDYLARKYDHFVNFEQLTPDASTREYFRIFPDDESRIACVYAAPFSLAENSYIDVTRLFLKNDLPVAKIFDTDGDLGIIVQEDFGDRILRDFLIQADTQSRENLYDEAIKLIARIQAATFSAYESNSIASKLSFDTEKLLWELNFFKTHYFESLRKIILTENENNQLNSEFVELAEELAKQAEFLCHRDFHSANLMIDKKNRLRIIDHQDARIGAVSYDLVSLLLDRVTKLPDENWLKEKKLFFLSEREKIGLKKISLDEFKREFELMTIQQCLKAIGTFSNQAANLGKTNYLQYIEPMFQIVLRSCEKLNKFKFLQKTIFQTLHK